MSNPIHTDRIYRVAMLCYGLSFLLPAIRTAGNFGTIWGFQAFAGSLFALLDLHPDWLANPAFWLGLYWSRRSQGKLAALSGIAAILLALTAPLREYVEAQSQLAPPGLSSTLLPGYYFWLASFIVLTGGAIRSLLGRSDAGNQELAQQCP
jgi:hypothetical protein